MTKLKRIMHAFDVERTCWCVILVYPQNLLRGMLRGMAMQLAFQFCSGTPMRIVFEGWLVTLQKRYHALSSDAITPENLGPIL
jgi:hypothetical protein